jgi:DNA modification methylase
MGKRIGELLPIQMARGTQMEKDQVELNKIYNIDCIEGLKQLPDESVDLVITSPPYYNLRDYGFDKQFGKEESLEKYINNLLNVFDEVKRVLKNKGSCWININDVYSQKNAITKKSSLLCIPDRLKIEMVNRGWICRNEIIWHKPNAMPSSAKNRFNNDYEKLYFFTKNDNYYFDTQYERNKNNNFIKKTNFFLNKQTKYFDIKQETNVRQGMNKNRGNKLIEVRKKLPKQEVLVNFLRKNTTIEILTNNTNIPKTKIEHWFRKDEKGFAYPSINDWLTIKEFVDDFSEEFSILDEGLTYFEYETDDINKNIGKGRIKRAVWSINTKPFKGKHFAPYPEKLVETPIKACCPINGLVLDPFMGSGTTALVAKKLNRNYIGFELSKDYCLIAEKRLLDTVEGLV